MRVRALDSMRGLAALVVVFHHCLLTYPDVIPWISYSPLRPLIAGPGAVLVFFTLSGFVLFMTFQGKDRFRYAPYVTKRVARIYLPFAFAILLSALLFELVQPHRIPALSDWFNHLSWDSPVGLREVGATLAMTDLKSHQDLNNVMWSLVHEMRISLIYPLLAFMVIVNWRAALAASFVISTACAVAFQKLELSWPYDPLATGQYLFLFVAGAALSFKADAVRDRVARTPGWILTLLWLGALALVTIPTKAYGVVSGLAAITLVALCFADRRLAGLLNAEIPIWLGRVSYSLYLVHLPVLLTATHLFYGRLPLPLILVGVVLTSLAAAEVTHRLVEEPAMQLGRILARRLSPKRSKTGTALPT